MLINRRLQIPQDVFYGIVNEVFRHSEYLRAGRKPDAIGRLGASTLRNMVVEMR